MGREKEQDSKEEMRVCGMMVEKLLGTQNDCSAFKISDQMSLKKQISSFKQDHIPI